MKTTDLILLGGLGLGAWALFSKQGRAAAQPVVAERDIIAARESRALTMPNVEQAQTWNELTPEMQAYYGNFQEFISRISSEGFAAKLASISDADWAIATQYRYGGSPLQLPDRPVPVPEDERIANLETIRQVNESSGSSGGFETIREGVSRQVIGGGIAEGGSVRVIYT